MRFLRFSYIIPRLILLVLFVLATEIGSGYLLRWALVTGGESAVGARVDITSVKSSLLDTRVLVRNISVANPSKPMQNLFEADRIEVDFNSHALLRKKLIADYGVVSGLQLGTARQTSGSLPERSPTDASSPAANWASPIAKQYADAWLTDLDARLANDLEQQFESVRLAEALGQRWPQKYQQLESQALAIKTEAKKLEQDVRAGAGRIRCDTWNSSRTCPAAWRYCASSLLACKPKWPSFPINLRPTVPQFKRLASTTSSLSANSLNLATSMPSRYRIIYLGSKLRPPWAKPWAGSAGRETLCHHVAKSPTSRPCAVTMSYSPDASNYPTCSSRRCGSMAPLGWAVSRSTWLASSVTGRPSRIGIRGPPPWN